jgi:hypothetical protein
MTRKDDPKSTGWGSTASSTSSARGSGESGGQKHGQGTGAQSQRTDEEKRSFGGRDRKDDEGPQQAVTNTGVSGFDRGKGVRPEDDDADAASS